MEGPERLIRLFNLMTETRANPRQTPEQLARYFGISRAQLYKDKKALAQIGFTFRYNRAKHAFEVLQDPFIPTCNLSLTEISSLVMLIRQLFVTGDYVITYRAIQAIKKLVANHPERKVREQLHLFLEDAVYNRGYGCRVEVLELLEKAMEQKNIVQLIYLSAADGFREVVHEVDVYMIFFKRRALYMDAHCRNTGNVHTYRLNRIRDVKVRHYTAFAVRDDYSFRERHRDSFSVFTGGEPVLVRVWFSPKKAFYIREVRWHHSEQIMEQKDGSIIYEVSISEPCEVLWWALQWGSDVEILDPPALRQMAAEEIRKMATLYGREKPRQGPSRV